MGGTVPTLLYYGLKICSPSIIVPLTFILCAITSLFTGSSFGSIATMGLALIPAILVLVTSALRMPAVPAMLGCTAISGVFACLLQKASLTTCYFGGMTLENGRLVHRQDDCSGCGLCAHSCGRGAVTIRELE